MIKTFETRDDFIPVLAAIKASLGPQADEHWPAVLDWALNYPGAEEDYIEKIWNSIKDAEVGWSYLEGWSRKHGCTIGAQHAFKDDVMKTAPDGPLDHAVRDYVWCEELERYVRLSDGAMLTANAFNAANVSVAPFGCTGTKSATAQFQNHPDRRKVIIPIYRPGHGVLTTETNKLGRPVDAVNLWRPSTLVPVEGDVTPWLEHMELIFGPLDGPAATHVMDWMAFVAQRPGEKINHALVIIGETEGTGKDTAFEPLRQIIGGHNIKTVTPEMLGEPWTHYLLAQLVQVEEMANFRKKEVANKLKPMVCSPPNTVSVNIKNVRQYDIPNIQNWLFFSNHEDAIPIGATDRRYWVHRCQLETPREEAYYKKLYDWYENGGYAATYAWLLARDISHFNPMAAPPMTEAKRTMFAQALSQQERWAHTALTEGEFADRTVIRAEEMVTAAPAGGRGRRPALECCAIVIRASLVRCCSRASFVRQCHRYAATMQFVIRATARSLVGAIEASGP